MLTAVVLFAAGRLPPVDGAPVDVMVGGTEVQGLILAGVRCADRVGRHEDVELVLRPSGRDGQPAGATPGRALELNLRARQ